MNCVIVNDACCLIDLRKGQLLHVLVKLPYRLIVPLPIRTSELLDFTEQEWRMLDDGGLETYDLPGEQMTEVLHVKSKMPGLSVNDCLCLVTTQRHENGILLTGDKTLRNAADAHGVRVHGVLWVIDQLWEGRLCPAELLLAALGSWREDRSVFLPNAEIDRRLRKMRLE